MSTQYYAAEATCNPVWLFQIGYQRQDEDGEWVTDWDTETVFSSRAAGEQYGKENAHNYGEKGKGWRVYSVCCQDDQLAQAIAKLRPELVDEYSQRAG